jgi:hypothetical protein
LDALKAGKLTDEITDVIQTVARDFQQNITKKYQVRVLSIRIITLLDTCHQILIQQTWQI